MTNNNVESNNLECASQRSAPSSRPLRMPSDSATTSSSPFRTFRTSHPVLNMHIPNLWGHSVESNSLQQREATEGEHRCGFVLACLESAITLSDELAHELDAMQFDYLD